MEAHGARSACGAGPGASAGAGAGAWGAGAHGRMVCMVHLHNCL